MTDPDLRRVTFFLAGERDLSALTALGPDDAPRELRRGERVWILQTFLRLAAAGYPVALADRAPEHGLVVFHAKQEKELLRRGGRSRALVRIGVRADNRQPLSAEFELLQNGRFADGVRRFTVPIWPQPGLIPRAPERGPRLERIAYKGFDRNLHPEFRRPKWREFLAELGIDWQVDSAEFAYQASEALPLSWENYREIDAVLAVRPADRKLHTAKPASKLVNAWTAGVPALLGPEWAFRELRRSPLDYLEVADVEEAGVAVRRLRDEPELFGAMVENGRVRARQFAVEAVTARWAELLFESVPRAVAAPQFQRWARLPVAVRRQLRLLRRLAALEPAR